MISDKKRSAEIRLRYKNRDPLNLSAVATEAPRLLEGLFDPNNFIGWCETLQKAGLNYDKIRIEPELTVCCNICGYECEVLWVHLGYEHGINAAEYREEFGNAEVASEALRAERMGDRHGRKSVALMPHWEPAWSPHYALDRIHVFSQRKIPLNYSHVAAGEPGLAGYVRRIFGSWDAGLKAAGLDPEEIREAKPRREFTKRSLLTALRRKQRERGGQLHIQAGRAADAKVEITFCFRLFGSYEKALEAAGIDPLTKIPALTDAAKVKARSRLLREAKARLKKRPRYHRREVLHFLTKHQQTIEDFYASWSNFMIFLGCHERELFQSPKHTAYDSSELIVKALRARQKIGLSIRESDICTDDPSLFTMMHKHFGNVREAVRSAGLQPPPRSYHLRDYPEPEDVIRGLQHRYRQGQSLYMNDVLQIAEKGGDRSLMKWAKRFFGDYRSALKAANVPDPGFKKPGPEEPVFKYPDADSVLVGIRARQSSGKGLGCSALKREKSKGGDTTLLIAARRHLGGWTEAVMAAGFGDVRKRPKKRRSRKVLRKKDVIEGIRQRQKKKWSLRAGKMSRSVSERGDPRLYKAGRQLYGSWDKALKAAAR